MDVFFIFCCRTRDVNTEAGRQVTFHKHLLWCVCVTPHLGGSPGGSDGLPRDRPRLHKQQLWQWFHCGGTHTQKLFLHWAAIWCSRHFLFCCRLKKAPHKAAAEAARATEMPVWITVFIRKLLVVFSLCHLTEEVHKRGSVEILPLNPFGVANMTAGFGVMREI